MGGSGDRPVEPGHWKWARTTLSGVRRYIEIQLTHIKNIDARILGLPKYERGLRTDDRCRRHYRLLVSWERETAFEATRQNFEWERNKRFEILRRKLDDGQETLEEISDLINLRFFRLQSVFDMILADDLERAESNWSTYMETVELWNTKLIISQNKLERLVSKETSLEFNNYETDEPDLTDPTSIHGQF